MRILAGLRKRVLTCRKVMWLFLCGMLVVSKSAVAQQTEPDQQKMEEVRDHARHEAEFVVKYGPRSSFSPLPQDEAEPKQDPATDAPKEKVKNTRPGSSKKQTIQEQQRPTTCPEVKHVDCMPPVPPERQHLCSPEYVKWLKENCGIKVVW